MSITIEKGVFFLTKEFALFFSLTKHLKGKNTQKHTQKHATTRTKLNDIEPEQANFEIVLVAVLQVSSSSSFFYKKPSTRSNKNDENGEKNLFHLLGRNFQSNLRVSRRLRRTLILLSLHQTVDENVEESKESKREW